MFDNALAAHPGNVSSFLGSATTGGFLKTATDILNSLEDPISGTIETTRTSAQTAITNQNRRIANEQDRIDILQSSLIARMAAADALIASLEQQVTYFNSLFESMNAFNKNK